MVGQPEVGQITFAVLVSFVLAGFLVKKFLDIDYTVPAVLTAIVTFLGFTVYTRPDLLRYMADSWPKAFFAHSITAILPLQIIAFGTIGSIIGYWLAIRFACWRKHIAKQH